MNPEPKKPLRIHRKMFSRMVVLANVLRPSEPYSSGKDAIQPNTSDATRTTENAE
jgi:hypothetical protein